MALDGVVCLSIVKELNNSILNGKINKIFEPNSNEIKIIIYSNGTNYALNISIDPVNYRLNLTTHQKQNPKDVFNFCMVLRKHLTGGTIKKMYMNSLERIIYIDIENYNEVNDLITKTLVIELMGKHSNVILLKNDNTIIDSLKHLTTLDNSLRDILPGYQYFEISSDKLDFTKSTFDEFYKKITESDTDSVSLSLSQTYIGISKSGVSYILEKLNISDNKTDLTLDQFKQIYNYFNNIINGDITKITFIKCFKNNKEDYYIDILNKSEAFEINYMIDDFYFNKEENEIFTNKKNNVLKLILNRLQKLESKLKDINVKLKECENQETYKLYGELLTSNMYKLKDNKENLSSITLENYYDNNKEILIPLDNTISVSNNARKYFKKYKKLQNSYSIITKQKELIYTEIKYLESLIYDIQNTEKLDELNTIYDDIVKDFKLENKNNFKSKTDKKLKNTNLPTTYNINGFTILVGKNNKQNDYLTCKLANKNDLWFHTKDIHGSHVVLKLEKSIDKYDKSKIDSIIYKCATIAAFYSKAKLSSNVPVDYTFIKYVKKPNNAKPGMVIYTDNKTLYVNPKEP